MGIWFNYAIVHKRLLIWWTDNNGAEHEEWFWGVEAEKFMELEYKANEAIQDALRSIIGVKAHG